MPRRCSIRRRFSSNWPHRLAKRRESTGSILKRWMVKGAFKLVFRGPCGSGKVTAWRAHWPLQSRTASGLRRQRQPGSVHGFAQQSAAQGVGQGLINTHVHKLADQRRVVAAEVDHAVVFGTTL